ncbi:hypothetical protein [Pontibacter akesuensis]|uniref:Uncharacterized protein n=1 Tax=Pontibacter akesuensis TaxID=388950 RepID=A0A1I7IFY1_9BACT|nr:hypothetical protein [Pontibacter akesuensis]GHA66998.1 hypothetical protein GCM10007389_20140 [Pontibacter akesuensis]SFU71835.1 hypothetical protein SAMN04487941_2185 [Pontibacter akesuensis]
MDAQEYNPHYIQINELYIDTVVIDDTDFITLWCFTVLDEEYKFVYLGCDFTQFNLILIAAGEKGKEIALHLAEVLDKPYDAPTLIPIKEDFDEYLELTGHDLIIYEPLALEDDFEEYDEDLPIEQLFGGKPNKTRQKYLIYQLDKLYPSKVFEPEQLSQSALTECFEDDSLELAQLYYDYLNAVENGYSEVEARQLSGLERELFFRMARKASELWK